MRDARQRPSGLPLTRAHKQNSAEDGNACSPCSQQSTYRYEAGRYCDHSSRLDVDMSLLSPLLPALQSYRH